ncbi:zf-CCHC domain-containing protein, partial [Tanacetum coccineum]
MTLIYSPGSSSTPIYSSGPSSTPIYSPGSLTPPRYSPGALTPQSYSPRTLRNAECSNCKHWLDKIMDVFCYTYEEVAKRFTVAIETPLIRKNPRNPSKFTKRAPTYSRYYLLSGKGQRLRSKIGIPRTNYVDCLHHTNVTQ